MPVPLESTSGVSLRPTQIAGIARAEVIDADAKKRLSWDRFVRLKAAAEVVTHFRVETVLDAGGYDGALGLFTGGILVEVIDPATTGGSILDIPCPNRAYDAIVAVDVLEHIPPQKREKALGEFSRVAGKYVVLNYPSQESAAAQQLMLELTGNPLVREHVEWPLPDSNWVCAQMAKLGFESERKCHTSIAIWLGQYLTLNLVPAAATRLNEYLIENCADEPSSSALYDLIVCRRV